MRVVFDYALVVALIPFLVFYMVKDIHKMKKAIWYISPKRWRIRGQAFLHDVDESLGAYIRGQLFVCIVIGVCAGVSFWIFDIPYAFILGLFVGVTDVIPYFGPIIGALPAILIAATISKKAVFMIIVTLFVLQFLESNILGPLIVGKSLHMHPVVIMLSLLVGGELFGMIGMIVAVPVVVILKVTISHFIRYRTDH